MGALDLLLPARCPVCHEPGAAPCAPCAAALPAPPALPPPPGLVACHALVAYDGGGRSLVAALKFRGATSVLAWVVDGLVPLLDHRPAVVTWVPALPAHRRARGVDPGEALARAVARRLDRPAVALMRRQPGAAQAHRSLDERRRGPDVVLRRRPPPGHVLVLDDVVTTGASMAAVARLVLGAGARSVAGAALARTPPPGRVGRHPPRPHPRPR